MLKNRTNVIEVTNLNKNFFIPRRGSAQNKESFSVLKNINFNVASGSWATLMGPSGSGKSTLLTLLAGLDTPSSGTIKILNQDLGLLSESGRTAFRAKNMGFVFQSFRLIPTLTALENVLIPLEILNRVSAQDLELAKDLLSDVGLGSRFEHLPTQLSGGEQQRVALARSFVSSPAVLFADEPTGNLDSKSGNLILELMKKFQNTLKTTLIVVTHDKEISKIGDQVLHIRDGIIYES